MTKYLGLDTETGGLDENVNALLTIGLVAYDDDRKIYAQEHILVQPEGMEIHPKAIEVNRIDLVAHAAVALPRAEAAFKVVEFVQKNFGKHYLDQPFVVGHNVQFDLRFMARLFKDAGVKQPYSYRALDTMGIALFLHTLGILPSAKDLKLDYLIKRYDIQIEEKDRHTALGDALATMTAHLDMAQELREPLEAAAKYASLCQ